MPTNFFREVNVFTILLQCPLRNVRGTFWYTGKRRRFVGFHHSPVKFTPPPYAGAADPAGHGATGRRSTDVVDGPLPASTCGDWSRRGMTVSSFSHHQAPPHPMSKRLVLSALAQLPPRRPAAT